jgi:NAD(P)H-hydrate epimerase
MATADALAVAAGIPIRSLMENAGRAVADVAMTLIPPGAKIAVLCGPGNNGGDGFVAARILCERGAGDVRVFSFRAIEALGGLVAEVARACDPEGRSMRPLEAVDGNDWDLVIDAIFGTGLTRPLDPENQRRVGVALATPARQRLAVDVPSGMDPTTGALQPWTVRAHRTVTFFRRKTGHLLLPGRDACGTVSVHDIGIPNHVLAEIAPKARANAAPHLPAFEDGRVSAGQHKYSRGHAVVVSGPPESTGAARLGARGALRAGAGLVTVASPRAAVPVNAAHLTAIMLAGFDAPSGLATILSDKRRNAVLIGPGGGLGRAMREMVAITIASGAATVLDADALTAFADEKPPDGEEADGRTGLGFLPTERTAMAATPAALFAAIATRRTGNVVLTPHEGEFKRLFPNLAGCKLQRALAAAALSGAVVVLKGSDTVIAAPDGRAAINENAPPSLATAGSGDVLAGFVTGLLAQGMRAFEAAAAAVWLHGACATAFGPGLIAEDIPEILPKVLAELVSMR